MIKAARELVVPALVVFVGLLALVGSVDASGRSGGSAPSFAAPRSYGTGRAPWSVAIGDLNGDRRPDLVAANTGANSVSVLLNKGHGSFRPRHDSPTGAFPHTVAIGDLNGDGKPDLAISNFAGTVSVLLNKGDGSFRAKHDYEAGDGPNSVAIGDLNGDGAPDLATPNVWAGTVSVLLGDGAGGFQSEIEYAAGDGTSALAVGDLNGDGKPDLATVNEENSVSVLLNRGDGSFGGKVDYRTGDGDTSVAIGDLNGDGKPDLATANTYANTVSVLLNNGDGSFEAGREYRTARGPKSVAIGDLTRDGKPDLAIADGGCACTSVGISVLANRGDGTFRPKVDFPAGRGSRWVAIGDLNGDGRQDVATANSGANTVSILLSSTRACTVPNVKGQTVLVATRTLARASCRVGKVHRSHSRSVRTGRVISQKPKSGAVLPSGGKVDLIISLRRKGS